MINRASQMIEALECIYRSKRPVSQITPSMHSSHKTARSNLEGAGVLLLENYRNNTNTKTDLAVILFRNNRTNSYQDGGGNIDSGEKPKSAAVRELKEESANLFRLSSDSLNGCPMYDHQGKYRAYAVIVTHPRGIQSKYYRENIATLKAQNAKKEWLETSDMARFYIDDLVAHGLDTTQGDLHCKDANGNPCVIFARTKACIRESRKTFNSAPTVRLEFESANKRGQPFTHGTKAYWTP